MRVFKLIVIAIVALLLAGLLVSIGEETRYWTIQWVYSIPTQERLNIDLSLDGGATYPIRLVNGYPCKLGTNTYEFSTPPDKYEWFTDTAKVRFQKLRARGATPAAMNNDTQWSVSVFKICGVVVTSPVTDQHISGSVIPVAWVSNEAGAQVEIGISTNNGQSYLLAAYADNLDGTNNYNLAVPAGVSGRVRLVVQSLIDSNCKDETEVFWLE